MRLLRPSLVALALCAVVVASCASGPPPTQLMNAWMAPGYVPVGFKKILVVGVTTRGDLRRTFEDGFVAALIGRGVAAVQSYLFIPQDGQVPNDLLESAIRSSGADAVLAARVIKNDPTMTYVPGQVYAVGGPVYYDGWGGYYAPAYAYGYLPPQVISTGEVVTIETTVFDAAKLKLVWSATTQNTNPTSLGAELPGFAKVVINAMADRGLIAVK